MARPRRKPPPVRCECGSPAKWSAPDEGYTCGTWDTEAGEYVDGCGKFYTADEAAELGTADGRIRGPEDVVPRLAECAARAAENPYLSNFDRRYFALCLRVGTEHRSVEVIVSDRWAAEQLGASDHKRASRARRKLESFNHVRRLQSKEVRMYAIQEQLARRAAEGKRPPVVLEIRKGPAGYPGCARCGGPIPDIARVSKKYCGDACRSAAFRDEGIDTTALDAALDTLTDPRRADTYPVAALAGER